MLFSILEGSWNFVSLRWVEGHVHHPVGIKPICMVGSPIQHKLFLWLSQTHHSGLHAAKSHSFESREEQRKLHSIASSSLSLPLLVPLYKDFVVAFMEVFIDGFVKNVHVVWPFNVQFDLSISTLLLTIWFLCIINKCYP